MRLPPLSVISSWPMPNYVNPTTHGSALLIVNIIFITLVVIAVVGRFYARLVIRKWFGWDDSMIALALLFTIGMTIVVILANHTYGWDLHEWDLSATLIPGANKIAFVAKLMFTLAATFTRLSLICFYYRLVKDSGITWFNWVLHVSVAWTVAVCISFICETIWLCVPVQAYWAYPPSLTGHCLDEGKVMLGGGIINCFSDLLTTVLPIPIVMRLQMPIRQRVGVCILLCLGLIVSIAGAIRTYFIWKSLIATWDETWYAYPLWIAAAVEIDLAVICACAPAWKSLLQTPVAILSSKVSSKISSLRSPNNSRGAPENSSDGKGVIFNPLRSLPWFQVTRLEFEKEGAHDADLESATRQNIELDRADDDQRVSRHDTIARHWRDVDGEDNSQHSRPVTPSLRIMKRQSLEQKSARRDSVKSRLSSPPPPPPPRRSVGSLLPGQWFGIVSNRSTLSSG